MAATVPAVGVRALVRALARINVPTERLLADSGIDRKTLDDPDGRIDVASADAVWASAYRLSGDERLAMQAVQTLQANDYRTLTYIAANCLTLGEGLRRILGFFDLIDRRIQWTLDATGDPVTLGLGFEGASEPLPRAPVEYTLGALVHTVRLATGLDWRPLRVDVPFSVPDSEAAAEHERVLGPMRYDAPATRLIIPRYWWLHPVPSADGALADLLTELARRLVSELPVEDDLRNRLRRAVGGALVGGPPTIGTIARQIGVSERSLQRSLGALGTTFRDEVDAVRRASAAMFIEDPNLALSEVSWLLGFSDRRAFTRAFRRWHGTSPSSWRRDPGSDSVDGTQAAARDTR